MIRTEGTNQMSSSDRLSPRQEALDAILATRMLRDEPLIYAATGGKLEAPAWDNRSHEGDRREIRRAARSILIEAQRHLGED